MKIHKILLVLLLCAAFSGCSEEDLVVQSLFDLSGAPLEYDDALATKFLNITAVSMDVSKEKGENLARMKQLIMRVMEDHPETELILFGETILGWYIDDDDPGSYQVTVAEPVPGPVTDAIGEIADSLDVYVVFGIAEKSGELLYNSQVLINPDGTVQEHHRKINLTNDDLASGFTSAAKKSENVTTFFINGIKTGMIVCADVSGYWLTEQLVSEGVELVLHSLASEVPEFYIDAVGRQFNAWEVFANRYGNELGRAYSGTTFVADPAGTIRITDGGRETYVHYRVGVR
jgi:predicted amidohydrolase